MNELNCKVSLEQKVSKKTGNPYIVLVLKFPNGYEKQVFLDSNETFIMTTMLQK